MTDGSITFSATLDNTQLEKELAQTEKKIEKTEKLIAEMQKKRSEASETSIFKAAELDAEKAKLQEIKDRLQDIRALAKDKSISADSRATYAGMIPGVQTELADQRTRVRALQAEYNKIDNSVLRYDEKLKNANATLDEQKAHAGELVQRLDAANSASAKMGDAIDQAGKHMDKLLSRVKKLASRVFIFTLITAALRSLRTWLSNVVKSNDEARASVAKLKGALLTLAQPLVGVIIPAFTKFVNILAKIAAMAANVVSKLFGTTASVSADAAENLYNEMNAIEGVGEAAEDAAGSLAGFDEINTISSENASSSGAGGADSDTIAPDFSGVIGEKLGAIEAIVGGALLALGAILAFSGVNIPLGITLMALGALTLATVAKDNWDAIVQVIQGPIGALTGILGGALFVIGAILTFSGANIPLGIGLMIAGATSLATAVGVNWDTISQSLQGPIGVLTTLLSGALLVLGAILTFSGANIGLGIGLMILGAAGLATAVAVNWDTIQASLKGSIGITTGIVSTALLAIGAIFTFTGANIPLGIGLMIVGAAALATAVSVNWDTIQTLLQGPIGAVTNIVSIAFLVLGAILTFTGAAIPLGIGLLVVGAVGLANTIEANWGKIPELLQSPIGKVIAIISAALVVLGIILLFTGGGIPLGIGLIIAGAASFATAISPDWDFIPKKVKDIWDRVKKFWNDHIAKYFTAAWWKQLGKDMLNGLIGSIESGLNYALSGVGSFVNKITGVLNKIPGVNIGSVSWGNVKLPRLATGAVIPPNREFLAVLGDQTSGNNIEAPESLIRKIVREEAGSNDNTALLEAILTAIKEGHVIMVGETVLGRTTVKAINNLTIAAGKPVLLI